MSTGQGAGENPLAALLAGVHLVDAHHHFWELTRFPYAWLQGTAPARFGDKSAIRQDYLPPQYLADMAGLPLAASVHVQANCGAPDPVAETRWLQDLSESVDWPMAAIAEVDLTEPDAMALIDRHAAFPILRGIRTPVAWDAEGRWRVARRPGVLADAGFARAARHLAERGLSLDMVVTPGQLTEVAECAAAHPDLAIVINHFATLELARADGVADWHAGLRAITQRPNVFLKFSGLWTADRGWSPEILKPMVDFALNTLGSDRIMYGSNQPVEGVNCPVPRQAQHLARILADRTAPEISDIFHRTACRAYRLVL